MASLSSFFLKGTRQTWKKLGDYQNGAVAIAKSSGHKILPVYHNSGKLWPKGSFIKKPGIVTVIIGETFICLKWLRRRNNCKNKNLDA